MIFLAKICSRNLQHGFQTFATFDAGKWIFSFVNPCVYFKAICGCMPWVTENLVGENLVCENLSCENLVAENLVYGKFSVWKI